MKKFRIPRWILAVGLGVVLGTGLLGGVVTTVGHLPASSTSVAYAKAVTKGATSPAKTSGSSGGSAVAPPPVTTVTQQITKTVTPVGSGANTPPADEFGGILPTTSQLGLGTPSVSPLWQAYPSGAFDLDTSGYQWMLDVIPLSGANIAGNIMSMIWWVNMLVSKATILILIWAFRMNLLSNIIGTITSYSQTVINGLLGGPTLVIVTLLVGAYAVYRGLIKWQVGRMLRSILASVIVLGVAFGYVGHISQYITAGSNLADSLSSTVMSTIDEPLVSNLGTTGAFMSCSADGKIQVCHWTSSPIPNTTSNALVAAGNQLWQTEVVDPWTSLTFGRSFDILNTQGASQGPTFTSAEALHIDGILGDTTPTWLKAATQTNPVLYFALKLFGSPWTTGTAGPTYSVANGTSIASTMLDFSATSPVRVAIVKTLGDATINHRNHGATVNLLDGQDAWVRLGATMMVTVLTVVVFLFVGSLALEMTIAQVLVIVALLVGPLVLFIGVFPEIGFRIFLKWLKLLLGAMFIRVLLAALMAVMFFGMEALLASTSYSNFFEPYLVMLLMVGGVWYLRRMLKSKGLGSPHINQLGQTAFGPSKAMLAGAAGGMIGAGAERGMGGSNPAMSATQSGRPSVPPGGGGGGASSREGQGDVAPAPSLMSRYMENHPGFRDRVDSVMQSRGVQALRNATSTGGQATQTVSGRGADVIGRAANTKAGKATAMTASGLNKGASWVANRGVASDPGKSTIHRGIAGRLAGNLTPAAQQRQSLKNQYLHKAGMGHWSSATPMSQLSRKSASASLWALNKADSQKGLKRTAWKSLGMATTATAVGLKGLDWGFKAGRQVHKTARRLDHSVISPVADQVFGVQTAQRIPLGHQTPRPAGAGAGASSNKPKDTPQNTTPPDETKQDAQPQSREDQRPPTPVPSPVKSTPEDHPDAPPMTPTPPRTKVSSDVKEDVGGASKSQAQATAQSQDKIRQAQQAAQAKMTANNKAQASQASQAQPSTTSHPKD